MQRVKGRLTDGGSRLTEAMYGLIFDERNYSYAVEELPFVMDDYFKFDTGLIIAANQNESKLVLHLKLQLAELYEELPWDEKAPAGQGRGFNGG